MSRWFRSLDDRAMNGPRRRTLFVALQGAWRKAVRTARLAIGVPDYDTYVRHLRAHHPERPVPSYAEFFAECQQRRYRDGGSRGCC